LAFLMFLYAATLFSNAYTLSDAAPVTFQFEATIATVDVSENFTGLPFEVAEGDTIRAALTLSSLGTGPAYTQPTSLRFWIGNMPLVAPAWDVLVSNDEIMGIDLVGRIAEPSTTPDHEGNPIGDTIYLRGIANQPFAGEIPGHPE